MFEPSVDRLGRAVGADGLRCLSVKRSARPCRGVERVALDPPPTDNVVDRLSIIGRRCAQLLGRAQLTDLFRIVIAKLPRFPELILAQFSRGKTPYLESVRVTSG